MVPPRAKGTTDVPASVEGRASPANHGVPTEDDRQVQAAIARSLQQTPQEPVPSKQPDARDSEAEILACSICIGPLFEPISLPCGHTFCREVGGLAGPEDRRMPC